MSEELEEQSQPQLDLSSIRNLLLRRRWYVVLPLFAVWALVWGVSWVLPAVYRSSTLILVMQPTVSQSIVGTSPSNDLQDRLDSIDQQVRSRTRLLGIIQKFGLYPKERARHASDDDLVARMNKALNIVPVRAPGKEDVTSFSITFDADNPLAAQQVTQELSDMIRGENLEKSASRTPTTRSSFWTASWKTPGRSWRPRMRRCASSRIATWASCPPNTSNLQILNGLQSQLQAEQDQLGQAMQHKVLLESLQNQYKTMGIVTARPGRGGAVRAERA